MGTRRRLDQELVRRGLARSRSEAQELITAGRVRVRGSSAVKAATLVDAAESVAVSGAAERYASRGGHKLAGGLDALGVEVSGRVCLDAGASTGGFTDVLLRRGAERVVAVDVGYGQLSWGLRQDPRVTTLDRTNVRHLTAEQLPGPPPDLVVADLSFISLTAVLGPLRRLATPDADFLVLVKPQFEVGPERVGKGGVVRDPQSWRAGIERVVEHAGGLGLGVRGLAVSPLRGPAGNVEFLLHSRSGPGEDVTERIAAAIEAGRALTLE